MIKRVKIRKDVPWKGLRDKQWLQIQRTTEEVYKYIFDSTKFDLSNNKRYIYIDKDKIRDNIDFNFIKRIF